VLPVLANSVGQASTQRTSGKQPIKQVANLSPIHLNESLNTLRFASKVRA
jgi:hypothetical protein